MVANYIPVSSLSLTSEYEFINPDINEANSIIHRTIERHKRKAFTRYRFLSSPIKRDVMFDLEFTEKRKNKIVNIKIKKHCGIISEINKMIIARQNNFTFTKINNLQIIIEGRIANHVINTYLKMTVLMGVRRFFMKIAK